MKPRNLKSYLQSRTLEGVQYWYVSPQDVRFPSRKAARESIDQSHPAVLTTTLLAAKPFVPCWMRGAGGAASGSTSAAGAGASSSTAIMEVECFDDSDDDDGCERCLIWGCKTQLLRCFGVKSDVGAPIGSAENAHVVCAGCLERWWDAQNKQRMENSLEPLHRRCCPVCKTELRRAGGEMRCDADKYHIGLLKIPGTW